MRRTAVALVIAGLVIVPAISGCTASAPKPKPTLTARAAFMPVDFSGTLSGEDDIRVPAAAHSANITVVCGGAHGFSLDGALNPIDGGLNGTCSGGLHRYQIPVAPLRTLHLELELDAVGSFVVETRFSSDVYMGDAELAKQCATMVTVASDAFNAEDGYTRGSVTLAQWQQRIAAASHALAPLDSEKPNILAVPLKTISDALAAPKAAPGAFESGDYEGAMDLIRQVCSDNGVATYINAEFGG